MPRVNLDKENLWQGKSYGPGEVEIPDDLAVALGLAPEPQPEEPEQEEGPTLVLPPADSLAAAVARLEELKAIYEAKGWKGIKAIGDELGVEKHPDGWDSSYLRIIEAEFSAEIAQALAEEGQQ